MKLPYVIDNQAHRLADVLREALAAHAGRPAGVARAWPRPIPARGNVVNYEKSAR